jgi:hypothetical protein
MDGAYHLKGRFIDGLLGWWARVAGFEVSFEVLGLSERQRELASHPLHHCPFQIETNKTNALATDGVCVDVRGKKKRGGEK